MKNSLSYCECCGCALLSSACTKSMRHFFVVCTLLLEWWLHHERRTDTITHTHTRAIDDEYKCTRKISRCWFSFFMIWLLVFDENSVILENLVCRDELCEMKLTIGSLYIDARTDFNETIHLRCCNLLWIVFREILYCGSFRLAWLRFVAINVCGRRRICYVMLLVQICFFFFFFHMKWTNRTHNVTKRTMNFWFLLFFFYYFRFAIFHLILVFVFHTNSTRTFATNDQEKIN